MANQTFTRDELRKYNGQNGAAAYIAIDGIVYDVTHSPAWKNGIHQGYQAGYDLTDALYKVSPHKDRVLANLPKVGILVGEE